MMTLDTCTPDLQQLQTLESALDNIFQTLVPIQETECIELKFGLGRILARTLTSPVNLPYERNSAMDGYAFCSEDLEIKRDNRLVQIGTSWAGRPYIGRLKAGECVRIMTGAILPENADSVVIQEQVLQHGSEIEFPSNIRPHQNIREAGEDLKQGNMLLSAGQKLNAADIALLAAVGLEEIEVIRPIKIAYCSTGDELTPLGQPLTTGKIYDSNRYLLGALLQNPCYQTTDLGILRDDPNLLEQTLLSAASENDAIISTGGVSVGDADHIKTVLEQHGQINFWKIAMKPGKPLAFGKLGSNYFFGLPGNPVAVATTFNKIVIPALNHLCGIVPANPLRIQAMSLSRLKKSSGRLEFQRGILSSTPEGTFKVKSAGLQGSHALRSLSQANCYIILDAACSGIEIGATVTVEPFSSMMAP